ncbi:MAG: DNA-directed RNA polymerase subunit beta, partial [Candidatus Omnitrophica bacterium]|nr:DNA-directed RNA polymerase subunit beta [Candidatus Omnitrophota bacterium]
LQYLGYSLEPSYSNQFECQRNGTTYAYNLKVKFRLIIKEKVKGKSTSSTDEIKEIKEQEVYLGALPIMTDRGTFIINGVERVVVQQLQRSPGVYFKEELTEGAQRLYSAKIIPLRGMTLEFSFHNNLWYASLLGRNKIKIFVTTLLRALGYKTDREIVEVICPKPKRPEEVIINTLHRDYLRSSEEAILKIYSLLQPGYPKVLKIAIAFFQQLFFGKYGYDLSLAGRKQLNRKLGLNLEERTLTKADIIETLRYLLGLQRGEGNVDDIDHLGNKRVRTVGELVEVQVEIGLARLARFIRERTTLQEPKTLSVLDLVNSRAFSAAINDFFNRNQLSQFLDQTNPLSELTHKRRLSAIGEGGIIERKRVGFEVRDVHYTHYGRICPIETPEGGNIGLITSFSVYAKIDKLGFLRTPYRKVIKGRVTDKIEYLSADEEDEYIIAQANSLLDKKGRFLEKEVSTRSKGAFLMTEPSLINYMDISPKQILSPTASLISFLEHDDANRALMGSNMQRQSVPLIRPESPLVKTGMEKIIVRDSGAVLRAESSGEVVEVDSERIVIKKVPSDSLQLKDKVVQHFRKFVRLNQDTCFHQSPIVDKGERIKKGQIISDGPAISQGELALGRNVFVAFMPWYGYNFEDAILISEKLVKEDIYTSIHIKEFKVEARETPLGVEEIARDIPNLSEEALKNLDEEGIIRIGAEVKPNDILVGKVSPKSETELSSEERLLRVIFGEKAKDVANTSLYVPPGISGIVINVRKFSRSLEEKSKKEKEAERKEILKVQRTFKRRKEEILKSGADKIKLLLPALQKSKILPLLSVLKSRNLKRREKFESSVLDLIKKEKLRERIKKLLELIVTEINKIDSQENRLIDRIKKGDALPSDVIKRIVVEVAIKKPIAVGDKVSGRHGNKGVIARILPEEDMPYLADGTPVEIVLNPLGVPSRMNLGQILETHLGWVAKTLGISVESPVFESLSEESIKNLLKKAHLPEDGKVVLCDGRTGEPFLQKVTVGHIYMMKLFHLADEKVHARSVGSYSLVTQQPLGGRAQFGGQRFGEMEVWALEGYGAAYTLQEILTVKSDDTVGRRKIYESIVKGKSFSEHRIPESFNVLMKELRGLGLNVRIEKDKEGRREISLCIASPSTIRSWSSGEVKKAETINYRTFKPEKDGLFCEKIFGPVKDWECACGKYKKIKYKGIVCDRCGVEITTSDVRRERMAHLELAAPVSYIWLFKSTANWMGLLLEMTQSRLEMILYYERYVVIKPGESAYQKKELLTEEEYQRAIANCKGFKAGIGAEAIRELLKEIDLKRTESSLLRKIKSTKYKSKRKNLIKNLRVTQGLQKSGVKPEWMIANVVPILPPDLRPLLPLKGGRFATSDLNDLYQRVINRNNRLKRLLKLRAPDIIIRNEKRMLQEAVDNLLDNGRHGNPVLGRGNRPLKSISDFLKGKQGRFRQNLLGKRVDYSGRAVIVVGPELKINECGLPKYMALELFAPFILRELRKREYIHTISSAKKALEKNEPEVWEILEEVIKNHLVLLNRQPTLHRLSIQAFQPRLIEENVIKLHPLVCSAFNADFDGDQMAVHVPLSPEAEMEANLLMSAATHVLAPANGKPIVTPTQDIVIGCYYLTSIEPKEPDLEIYSNSNEVLAAYYSGRLSLHTKIKVQIENEIKETTVGRILFNEILPVGLDFKNLLINKEILGKLISEIFSKFGYQETIKFLDEVKELGFRFATLGGISISIDDLIIPERKKDLVEMAKLQTDRFEKDYRKGIITDGERYNKVIDVWASFTNKIAEEVFFVLDKSQGDGYFNPIFIMVDSGARGTHAQVNQLAGMRGLMTRPTRRITGGIGEIIETPVISNFKEGLSVLEYFISTHGGRKGLVDTALKTSDAGYLSRRLVDVVQNVVITEEDCNSIDGVLIGPILEGETIVVSLKERIVGRVALDNVVDIITDKIIVKSNEIITPEIADVIIAAGIEKIRIRSVLTCKSERGVCRKCYGWNLATRKLVETGEAAGIVAAQSIGEPGTQLTLRTFHYGGIASRIVGESKIKSKYSGYIRLQNLKTVTGKNKNRIVLNKDGEIAIYDERDREIEK